MDSEASKRSGTDSVPDLEAGLAAPLLPAGPAADPEPLSSGAREREHWQGQAQEQGRYIYEDDSPPELEPEVGADFVSRMRKMVHFWWSSRELTPCRPKLYMDRLVFLVVATALAVLAACSAVILTYIVVMMVLVPRVVVVNCLVDPFMAESPDWGPSLIACGSALILGVLFILDGWAERTYRKEWFGLCDWSDSWICLGAQLVLLYLFFETVYIALSTFILSFLTVSPKVASLGVKLVAAAGPVNVLALLLASATVCVLLAVFVFYTERRIDAAVARSTDEHSSSMKSLAWNTLVFVDTVFRVIHYLFLGVTLLCCIYFIVYGAFHFCSFVIHHIINAFFVHDLPAVIPFPSLD
ncbi:hypothetical protein MPTK1_3g20210 [Marchantia polymorpha subsp. ruderalis]|uniref:Uncharacterized protein n=2 Tax=Marchantia polymorpha TaxID=3197 RepID=A0AAF6B2U9_MARPO|nr:hypothetical protein MARPO_0049s0011 [Marchantia polymorpha]BBN06333.1 hypothetical protein Mp_3g20210 [Marchantia polymorpha subsp. ruderalis]|eukprot:PTQ38708.1 hypothetical protein MARPO_0049s0011 [Marchantia polymorpha]